MYGPSAAERIAMARRLIARNRLQEALDILNEAVRQDPRYPDTFEARAEAFEMMGMFPHAAADRRKAADLRASFRPATPPPPPPPPEPAQPATPPPVAETPVGDTPAAQEEDAAEFADAQGEPDAVAEVLEEAGVEEPEAVPGPEPAPEPEPAPVPSFIDPDAERQPLSPPPPEPEPDVPQEPQYTPEPQYAPEPQYQRAVPAYAGPPRPSVTGAMLRAASVVLLALGVFIAIGVAIYLALGAVGGDDDGTSVVATSTPTGSETDAAGEPTADAVPQTVEEALRGDPYGFSSVQTAWEGAGFTVTVGDFSEVVAGFSEPAVDLTISRDGLSMEMSILMYDGAAIVENDWSLSVPVAPRLEGVVPVGSQAWYNGNVVVIVRVNDDTLRPDALEAFLDMA